MQPRRTDLAWEAKSLWMESADQQTQLEGVEAREGNREGMPITMVKILNEKGVKALGKPMGTYITVTLAGLNRREEDAFGRAVRAIAEELRSMIQLPEKATVLVVGLGNRAITSDAIGPEVVRHTMVTRHLVEQLPESFGVFRPVAAVVPGVLGTTGVESGELIRGTVERVRPDCVLVVDALAARSLSRLCTTVQLADSGIVPGSGVGNHRAAINRETLGIPVIAIGVPTVVDAGTLAADLMSQTGENSLDPALLGERGRELMVTPKDIDVQVSDVAKVIGYGINLALQSGVSIEDVTMFLS